MDDPEADIAGEPSSGNRNLTLTLAAAVIIALVAFSEHLALNRIFQVDELQYVFTARLLATQQAGQFAASANLMLLGPMTWLAGSIDHSALLLRTERLMFLGLFWLNLCLIVRGAGYRLRSRRGLFALVLVATLAPLWDYGFEIRHDNALLAAILLAWRFARPLSADARRNLFLVGLLAVTAQFLAFKAFVYVIPIVFLAMVGARLEDKRPLWQILVAPLAGALTGLAGGMTAHWLAGTWSLYASDTKSLGGATFKVLRFSPLPTLLRVLPQSPLLVIAVLCAIAVALRQARLHAIASRESLLPEAAFFAVAVVALFANPTPYPYNLVLLVPQAALLCLRLRPLEWPAPDALRVMLVLAVALHLLTWFRVTRRHLYMSNARQLELMSTAEEITDPARDRVFDGTGLVPSRRPPGHHWLIHGFTIQAFRDGTLPSIRSQLAEGRTPVIIPNYRTAWLTAADHQFISEHYLPLAGDFLVAGTVLTQTGRTSWDCPVTGRYYCVHDPGRGDLHLGGQSIRTGPLTLVQGPLTFDWTGPGRAYVIWLGPTLQIPPALGPGDASRVFVNWY